METRALNVCWSGPLLEHAEDSEEDETPVRTGEIEYEQGDRLFMTRVLPEPTAEELRAAYHKWLLTICDGCFDTLKSSKMQS